MRVETKFLRLFRAVELGDDVDGWRVCWLGGWDKCRVLFVVMVERVTDMPGREPSPASRDCAPRGCDHVGKEKEERKRRGSAATVRDRGEEC